MKKITQNLRWLVTLLTMIVSVGAWATDVEIVLSEQGYTNEQKVSSTTSGDVTLTYNQGTSSTAPAYYNTGSGVRVYAGGNLTITANGKKITSVSVTHTKEKSPTVSGTPDGWSTSTSPATWEGEATEVVLNVSTKGHIRIQSVVVTYVDGGTPTPTITVDPATVNVSAEGGDGTIKVTYKAFEPESFDIKFCESDGTPLEDGPDWITALCEYPEEGDVVNYSIDPNDGEARTAYFKVFSYPDPDTDPVYSELITITQAEYVAPSIATLPFEFDGGRADIEETEGLTQEGLGSDYSGNVPKLKFDGTGDWVLLQFDETPGNLSFDIKGNGFSGGTFTVQTSTDGKTYTNLETYTELGDTQTETFENLSSDVRFIKWVYTEKSTGNVGLGNIKLEISSTAPQIIVANTTIDVDANEYSGTLEVTYKNIDPELADIYFYAADGETAATYDWIVAELDGNNNIEYLISANEGEARTAYLKVYGLDAETNDIYSSLITINQAAYVAPVSEFATLPFEFDDGKSAIESTDGLTQEGLDSDYGSSPKLKFNGTGDWVLLQFDEVPGNLSFDIKGNSFSGGTFKVQTSTDGKNYSDLETYTELGNTQTEEFVLNSDVRYIKWIYTEKSGGNVALGNIKVMTLPSVSITIGESKWSTYVAEYHVQFPTGVSAFTVETINANSVTLGVVENNAVKKGTAVLVYSATPDTYSLELVNKNNCSDTSTNQLKAGPKTGDGTIYALANKDQGVGFYPVGNSIEVPAGKAYLDTSSAKNLVKGFLALGGLADAINNIAVETANGTIFNIAGQKVKNITKGGLYIVNGKKVFVK